MAAPSEPFDKFFSHVEQAFSPGTFQDLLSAARAESSFVSNRLNVLHPEAQRRADVPLSDRTCCDQTMHVDYASGFAALERTIVAFDMQIRLLDGIETSVHTLSMGAIHNCQPSGGTGLLNSKLAMLRRQRLFAEQARDAGLAYYRRAWDTIYADSFNLVAPVFKPASALLPTKRTRIEPSPAATTAAAAAPPFQVPAVPILTPRDDPVPATQPDNGPVEPSQE